MELLELAKKISSAKFDLLADHHKLDSQARSRAHRVLVEGLSVNEVAASDNVSGETVRRLVRQLVGTIVEQVRLTDAHFELAAAEASRMTPRNIELVRQVLVEGKPVSQVASAAGISRVTLNKAVSKIKKLAIPEGWRVVTLTLPEAVAEGVEQMELEAYKDYLEAQKEQ
jgi:DNA-binding CsgD family transcriptional regulator